MNLYFEIFIDKFIFSLFSIGSLLFEFSKIYKTHSTKSSPPTTHLTHLKFAFNSNRIHIVPLQFFPRLVHRITIITRLSHSTLQKKKETLPIPGKIERRKSWKRAFDTSIIDHVPQANWQESNGRGQERRIGSGERGKGGHRAHLWHHNRS